MAGSTLGARLEAARRDLFVGRQAERDTFARALAAEGQAAVLFVHGPGGIGKSTLLQVFAAMAADAGYTPRYLDARALDPTPQGLLSATEGLGDAGRAVLLLDTYELLGSLDGWIRAELLPALPGDAIVVLAGRRPPGREWRGDPGWAAILRVMPLRNLTPAEATAFLSKRDIPPGQHEAALAFTHGHPLALALVADLAAIDDGSFRPEQAPNIISELVDQFVESVPSERHRDALYLCAHSRVTTQELIEEAFGSQDAAELFAWLRSLTFIQPGPDGLFPHDLAREALDLDLRWRAPSKFNELHAAVRRWVLRRMEAAGRRLVLPVFYDLLFLHRHNPVMAAFTSLREAGSLYLDEPRPGEAATLIEWARTVEGEESARVCAFWLEQQPGGFRVIRDPAGRPQGFCAAVVLPDDGSEADEIDPCVPTVRRFIGEQGPLRPGEDAWLFRLWIYPPAYHLPSPAMDLLYAWTTMHWMTTPGQAWAFICTPLTEVWTPMFNYINFPRAEGYDFTCNGRTFGLFAHDWRLQPPAEWMSMMGVNELLTDMPADGSRPLPPPEYVVLSEPAFRKAAATALRDLRRPESLARNPLLGSRLVHDRETPARNLIEQIEAAADELRANPRDEKLYRVVHRTYLDPAPTQEAAAERLDLPWSTYRRHLAAGTGRVIEALWQRELRASADSTLF